MTLTSRWFIFPFFILSGHIFKSAYSIDLQSYSACYGNTADNFLKPSCGSTAVIAMDAVLAFAKPISTGCPQEQTVNSTEWCCRYNITDCGVRYTVSPLSQYATCSGNSQCTAPVSWTLTPSNTTSCSATDYLSKTSYMRMDYFCVPKSHILGVCSGSLVQASEVFIWNSGYPSAMTPGSDMCSCIVEVSCDTKLQVTLVDIRLATDNGSCAQNLTITDGTDIIYLDCAINNNFNFTSVYTSSSYNILLEVFNRLIRTDGYFWIQITGVNKAANVSLSCGGSSSYTQATGPKPTCPSDNASTTITTTAKQSVISTTTPYLTTTTTNMSSVTTMSTSTSLKISSSKSDSPKDDKGIIIIIAVVVVVVLAAIAAGGGILYWRHKAKVKAEENKRLDEELDENHSDQHPNDNPLFWSSSYNVIPGIAASNTIYPVPFHNSKLPPLQPMEKTKKDKHRRMKKKKQKKEKRGRTGTKSAH